MIDDYEISLATPDDIPGILTLQEPNLVERGGGLSVRQTADWYQECDCRKVGCCWSARRQSCGVCLRDITRGKSPCGDHPDYAARFPGSA